MGFALVALAAIDAWAAEGGYSNYVPGTYGDFGVALAPAETWTLRNDVYLYDANADRSIRSGLIETDTDLQFLNGRGGTSDSAAMFLGIATLEAAQHLLFVGQRAIDLEKVLLAVEIGDGDLQAGGRSELVESLEGRGQWLDAQALPAEVLLEVVGVAERHTIIGADVDEIAPASVAEVSFEQKTILTTL